MDRPLLRTGVVLAITLLAVVVFSGGVAAVGDLAASDGTDEFVSDSVNETDEFADTADGPTVYVGSENETLYALDPENGLEPDWEFETDGQVTTAPTVVDGTVYVGSSAVSTGTLYALDAETGDVEWQDSEFQGTGDVISSSPTVVDDVVYIGAPDGFQSGAVRALDADTGDELWISADIGEVPTAPNVVGETVFVSSDDGTNSLTALDVDTGELEWQYEQLNDVGSEPVWHNGTVYVGEGTAGAGEHRFHAVAAETGAAEWTFDDPSTALDTAPVAYDGTVYIAVSGDMYALDAETGDVEWMYDGPGGESFGEPTVYDDRLYAGTTDTTGAAGTSEGRLYAFDLDTGDVEWINNQLIGVYTTPTVHDGVVYVGGGVTGNDNGTLYSIDADTGDTLAEFTVVPESTERAAFRSPTYIDDTDGDSIGTRVRQGILGHTDAFPDGGASIVGQVTDSDGDGVQDATVDPDGEFPPVTTNATGQYDLAVLPGTYTVEATAFGFDTDDTTVTVEEGETAEQEFDLDAVVDAAPLQGQDETVDAGDDIDVLLDVANADTITVENTGTANDGLTLLVDGEPAAFGESVDVSAPDGEVDVTVETTVNATGTVELEHTVAGLGDTLTVTTGPSTLVGTIFEFAVVDDDSSTEGSLWADAIEDTLTNSTSSGAADSLLDVSPESIEYEVEHVTSDDVLGDIDAYDAYFVHALNETNEGAWFDVADDVGAVYTGQYRGGETLEQRAETIGDPDDVTRDRDLDSWHITDEHLILEDIAEPGDEILVHTSFVDYGGSFTGADGQRIANANDGNGAIAVDDDRADVLLTAVGSGSIPDVDEHTDEVLEVLANALVYGAYEGGDASIEGQVTDAAGDPLDGVTVDIVDEFPETTTGSDGSYDISLGTGGYTVEADKLGFEPESETLTIDVGETIQQDFELEETVDVTVVSDQPVNTDSGEEIDVTLAVANAETLTVENTGDLDSGLTLSIDGETESFGEPVSVSDGTVDITVETTDGTQGTVELEHTVADGTDETTATTGPTQVFGTTADIAIIQDSFSHYGEELVEPLNTTLTAVTDGSALYDIEQITSSDALSDIDAYDAYFVQNLDESSENAWFDTTDDVPTVYTSMHLGPETVDQRSEVIGDPGTVAQDYDLATWEVTTDHLIFQDLASPGDEILAHTDDSAYGAWFEGTTADVIANANNGNGAIAVDDDRSDVLLTAIGNSNWVDPDQITDAGFGVLANSIRYAEYQPDATIEGQVTDVDGEPIADATVDLRYAIPTVTTNATGHYEIAVEPGQTTLEASGLGFQSETAIVDVSAGEAVEQDFELEAGGLGVEVNEGQRAQIEGGESVGALLEVAGADTLTVENTGSLDSGLELAVDGEPAEFGEAVPVDDGEVRVTVGTEIESNGTLGLEHTVASEDDQLTVTSGPTDVLESIVAVAVVEDTYEPQAEWLADNLESQLDAGTPSSVLFDVEHVNSGTVLDGGSLYDVHLVTGIDDDNEAAWFDVTDGVGTIYTVRSGGWEPMALLQRAETLGDPDDLTLDEELDTWDVTVDHPIFDGIAGPGETVQVNEGGSFTATDGEVIAEAGDGNNAVAVDDDRRDVLFTGIGFYSNYGNRLEVTANAVQYLAESQSGSGVEGTVTDADGEPIADATVTVDGMATGATTGANGEYGLTLDAGQYTLAVSAFGFETVTETVTIPDDEFVEISFQLGESSDLDVVDEQSAALDSSKVIETAVETVHADTLTVENNGSLDSGLELTVDGEPATFGEPVSVDDGRVNVSVETTDGTQGTVELEHTIAGVGESTTVVTGPTDVFEEYISLAVVDDTGSQEWVPTLETEFEDGFGIEQVTSEEALVDIDAYDAYFVHEFGSDTNTTAWFDQTADIGTVYISQSFGPDTLEDRADEIGDPDEVSNSGGGVNWTITNDHPIFTGVAERGDVVPVHTSSTDDSASFTNTSADVLAAADNGDDAIAVDDSRKDIMLATLGRSWVGVYEHTEDSVAILGNALAYLGEERTAVVEGQVTDTDEQPVSNASVNVVDDLPRTTTDTDGTYEVALVAGEHTLEVSQFGFETTTENVTVSDGETVTEDIELEDSLDVAIEAEQPTSIDSGEEIETVLEVVNADTLTVENTGDLESGLELTVDGEPAEFGEDVQVDDGPVEVVVETENGTDGTVELQHTLAGLDETVTVTTGPTDVFELVYSVAVVEDDSSSIGEDWADAIEDTLGNVTASGDRTVLAGTSGGAVYEVEHVTSDDILGEPDAYDAYFVHGLDEDNEQVWFDETDDVGTIYTAQHDGPDTLEQRSTVLGDPGTVTQWYDLDVWHVETEHPLFDGVADPGDEIELYEGLSPTRGASFDDTAADVVAGAADGDDGIAVDDDRADILLTTIASSRSISVEDHTDAAVEVLANAVLYAIQERGTVEGTVTDSDGEPVAGATVAVVDEPVVATTDADGEYQLTVEPGTYTLEASAFGFESATEPVTVSAGETVERDFDLDETPDVAVDDDQDPKLDSGETINTSVTVTNGDTLTVENTGDLDSGLTLYVDGESTEFGTAINITGEDGPLPVAVDTTANTSGVVELEHTVAGDGETATATTGPTQVFENLVRIGVVEDNNPDWGVAWATAIQAKLEDSYEVEHVTSADYLDADTDTTHDAYFVHGLDEDNEQDWFDETDDVGTVYTANLFSSSANTLEQRSETIGDPGLVTTTTDLDTWHITDDHPLFEGVADPGDEVPVYDDAFSDSGASFLATSADSLAEANDGDHAIAIDDFRQDVLLTTIGHSSLIEPANHTDAAIEILANSVTHYAETENATVTGQVTGADGDPVANATVEVAGTDKQTTTDADGTYELSVVSGEYMLQLDADGFDGTEAMMPVRAGTTVEQDVELAPTHEVGDVARDGELSITDAARIQQQLAELDPEPFDPMLADVNRDGEITIVDAVLIQQYLADIRDKGTLEVSSVSVTDTVTKGEPIEVSADLENVGGLGAIQTAELRLADDPDDLDDAPTVAASVADLGPDVNESVSADVSTDMLVPGTYYIEVRTDDDAAVTSVEVTSEASDDAAVTTRFDQVVGPVPGALP